MKNVSDFFSKFQNLLGSKYFQKEAVILAFKEVLNIEIDKKSFEIKDGIIILKINSSAKSAVFMRKAVLIDLINNKLNKKSIFDIR